MSGHTPGPWKVGSKLDMSGWVIYHHGDKDNIASNVRAQDAYLLAAAPDLLEALKSLMADEGYSAALPAYDTRAKRAMAAIAKAEGK